LRPTDPNSPFSKPAPAVGSTGIRLAAARVATDDNPQTCAEPRKWWFDEWSPDGSPNRGLRVWACGPTKAIVQEDLSNVLAVGSRVWSGFTFDEPDGMGLPVPDTEAIASEGKGDGNGKIDVYLLEPLAECRVRNGCQQIPGNAVAAAPKDFPLNCAQPGFPVRGCSGYMLVSRLRLWDTAAFPADFAHEFFHILQMAHNGQVDLTWYHEASAVWAEFHAERESSEPNSYLAFQAFQAANQSLLWYRYLTTIQYRAWGWPLYQAIEEGPSNVYETWQAIEGAIVKSDVDKAIDSKLSFASEFRNFAVRNAQPNEYIQGSSTGLDADSWQTKEGLFNFPTKQHFITSPSMEMTVGKDEHPVEIDPLSAQYDKYEVKDPKVRQIEIDISKLTGAATADLDVIAQLKGGDKWTRFTGSGGKVTLCRDEEAENVEGVLIVVVSNHDFSRRGDDPDESKRVKGNYTVENKDECEPHDLHIGGRIDWNAETSIVQAGQLQTQSVSGSADVIIHVVSPYLLLAEREDHSTYNYDYSNNFNCASSHESGTLESYAGQPDGADKWDYSIAALNPGGPLGQDWYMQILMPDYCGPSMQGDVQPGSLYMNGFPDCEPTGDQLIAHFDGVENYVIDCEVFGFNGVDNNIGEVSGHVHGVLHPLDGPHPTPPY
jgi:hypothetical protein